MSVITTNVLALTSQNNLQKSQSALGSAIERLSSGMRINSAKDDAAGQAIANRFTANIKGLTQAARNANDGISIAQTTEGSLNEINNNLQRIREQIVQANNGTNSAEDLVSINEEIVARVQEINRVSEQTQFNGVKVLEKDDTLGIQVGAHDNETINISLKQVDASTLFAGVAGLSGIDDATDPKGQTGIIGTYTPATAGSYVAGTPASSDYVAHTSAVMSGGGTTEVTPAVPSVGTAAVASTGTKGSAATATVTGGLLEAIDKAISEVDSQRSALGAIQNRFESTVTNLQNTVTNLSAARSRIEDADYAVEVSNMTRAQILQQAGTSVLAQANQVPQSVLSLLG